MEWKQIPLGPLQTNCYCLIESLECLIIDPGGDSELLIEWLNHNSLQPNAILLTHAHFDHIGAVSDLVDKYQIPVYVHKEEDSWLTDPLMNGSQLFFPNQPVKTSKNADFLFSEEETINIGPFSLQLLETPGHSPGSVSFYMPEQSIVFSGDVLFQGSIGRTDLPGGDYTTLLQTIKEKFIHLPIDTIIAPGHGPTTTIKQEKLYNPFLEKLV